MSTKLINQSKKPTFFPSISNDETTWFWKHGIKADGMLISYDVLLKNKIFKGSKKSIKQLLGFKGLVTIDSGAFGSSQEHDPVVVYEKQKQLKADIGILLDQIAAAGSTKKQQKESIDVTLKNAATISKLNKNKIQLMGVIQGADKASIEYCAKELRKLKYNVIGVPLSNFSKHRKYKEAAEKFLLIKKQFPATAIFHGLGCGSRTLIAILTHLGVRFFDSSAFYKAATFNEAVDPESFCSINKPNSKKECAQCLFKQAKPSTFQEIVNYNLREVLKEVQRCRCAVEAKQTKKYLSEQRLSKGILKKIEHLL